MDPSLLEYYNSELAYMRKMAATFAAAHPGVAKRLGMQDMEVADPFVERLIESFCFLSARTRLRLDAEFPRFTQRLLEVIYPNYVAPTPSMAIVRLEPSPAEGDLADGFVVPRGTLFRSHIPPGQQTACQFRSGMDITLWPLELLDVRLTPPPDDVPLHHITRTPHTTRQARSAPPAATRTGTHLANMQPVMRHAGHEAIQDERDDDALRSGTTHAATTVNSGYSANAANSGNPDVTIRGALRLRLRTFNGLPFSALRGLERLPLYLSGDEQIATRLFELLHAGSLGCLVRDPQTDGPWHRTHSSDPVQLEGFSANQTLLPLPWNAFHGHNLVHEYFACPSRFLFLALDGLGACFSALNGQEAEVVILLDRPVAALAPHVDAASLALFCTPVINLFPMRTDRVEVRPGAVEFHIVPDRSRPMDFEIHSVSEVRAYRGGTGEELIFRPLYTTHGTDPTNYGRYFSLRRERRLLSDKTRMHGAQTGHIGTEVYLSLVDQADAPYKADISTLSVQIAATNRELSRLLTPAGLRELTLPDAAPVRRASFVRFPTPPHPPYADQDMAWRLIHYLGLSCLTLEAAESDQGGQALRDFLTLMSPPDQPEMTTRIQSLVGCAMTPVTRRMPGKGPLIYGRGVQCRITMDETGFSGSTPYIFALVLSRFLTRHASINTFIETELRTLQRGRVALWPAVKGGRAIL